jgi:uncharacterized membrane protein/glycosyltransferase involved in cell wall biosynthesis
MPRKAKQQFVSIVINSLNGEKTLGATLDSLLKQTYPKDRYEIIVVNDGSSDKTADVARSYEEHGVQLVDYAVNRGISGARSAGLAICKGTIFAGFDDDCVAQPDWLVELMKGYTSGNPAGVGSVITEARKPKGITQAYISARESNPGTQIAEDNKRHYGILRRLWRYVTHQQSPITTPMADRTVVSELYGATCSFPVSVLKKVDGWRVDMSGIEDRDISQRIHEAFPERPFYRMSKAIITQDRGQTLWQYLLRSYKRGPVNLAFHRKNHLIPPFFPFPPFIVFLCFVTAVLALSLLPVLMIVLPLILYARWPRYAYTHRKPMVLLFAYIQLIEESMVIAGLLRGYVRLFRQHYPQIGTRASNVGSFLAVLLAIAAWCGVLLHTSSTVLHTAISIPFLLLVPGYFIWRALAGIHHKTSLFRILSYSVGLSLLTVMMSGLLLNEIYIILGKSGQFMLQPLTYMIGVVTALFVVFAFIRAPRQFRLSKFIMPKPVNIAENIAAILIGLFLPVLAVAGALTLNNGGSSAIALLSIAAVAGLVLLMAFSPQSLGRYYGWFLYSICVSLLLGTSLRGWNITGHDILQEYQVFQLTLTHAAWHMSYYHDPYMACLSITILPTIIQKLTGINDPYIFKVIFQLFFALIAPIMYDTLSKYVSVRKALLATITFMFFPTFFTDMMMLNRQEAALLFFALSLYVGLDHALGRQVRSVLCFLLLVGMVLSHYSTSYVAIAVMLVSFGVALAWQAAMFVLRRERIPLLKDLSKVYRPTVILAAMVVLVIWGSVITQTSTNIYSTLGQIQIAIAQKVHGSSGLKKSAPVVQSSVAHFAAVSQAARRLSASSYYPPQTVAAYPVGIASERISPAAPVLTRFGLSTDVLANIYTQIKGAYAILIEGLIMLSLGLAVLLKKRWDELPSSYICLGIACVALIGLQVYLPSSAINYGLTRLIQQSLLILALPIVFVSIRLLKLLRIPEHVAEGIFALGLVSFFIVLTGLIPTLTGGFRPALALSNDGLYYQAYYTHQEEVVAAQWLRTDTPVGSRVYSDEFMRRKLIAYGGVFSQPTLVPGAIPIDSYTLLDYSNVLFDQVPAYDGSVVIYYKPPAVFLTNTKNLLYVSDHIRIYK